MTLASMALQSLLRQTLNPLHLEVKPSAAQVAGRLLAAGAVGAVVGAGLMALLTPASGPEARATLRRGLSRLTPARPLAAPTHANGTGTASRTPVPSAQIGA